MRARADASDQTGIRRASEPEPRKVRAVGVVKTRAQAAGMIGPGTDFSSPRMAIESTPHVQPGRPIPSVTPWFARAPGETCAGRPPAVSQVTVGRGEHAHRCVWGLV